MAPSKKNASKASKPTGGAAKSKAPKVANPLFPKREKNFRIGGDIRVSEFMYTFACMIVFLV